MSTANRTGAHALLETLVENGVEVCFTNPGTSEMHFVAALDHVTAMRPVLCLFEGVATGAADGYARMAGKPACTLLHLGPGLGNSSAYLHTARKTPSPVVNIVGNHATWHQGLNSPLDMDVETFAGPISDWVHQTQAAGNVAQDTAAAITAAQTAPGQVASLILPSDVSWDPTDGSAVSAEQPVAPQVTEARIAEVIEALKQEGAAIFMGTPACTERGLTAAGRIQAVTGCRLMIDMFVARLPRGAGQVPVERLPYFDDQAHAFMAGTTQLVLAGNKPPVTFFAFPGRTSHLTPENCETHILASPSEDVVDALERVARALEAPAEPTRQKAEPIPAPPTDEMSLANLALAVGRNIRDGDIVVDEGLTAGWAIYPVSQGAPAHDWLFITGGAIGWGAPAATGAAVACADRKVLCLHGEGGLMYTVQALWTQAKENLDVVTVVFSNGGYAVLDIEALRLGLGELGPQGKHVVDMTNPAIDFVQLAGSMGVPGERVETAPALDAALAAAMDRKGPYLIEAIVPPDALQKAMAGM